MKYIILLTVLLFSCEPPPETKMDSKKETKSIQVKTSELKLMNIDDYFETTGQIRGYKEIDLISNVSGRVENFRDNGSYVYKGNTIFEIDSKLFKNQMMSAKSQLDAANKSANKLEEDLMKYKSLLDSKDISLDEYKNHELTMLNAKQTANAAEVQFEQARLNYENAVYIAPFSGFVGQLDLTTGQTVSPGTIIGKLADLSRLKSVVHLSIDEAMRFEKGDKCYFINDQLMLEGYIESVSPIADALSGTYLTKIVFDNPKKEKVISGIFGTIKIVGQTFADVFVLENDFIINKKGKNYIFLAKDSMTKQEEVRIKQHIGNHSIIEGQIEEGDRYIMTSVGRLGDGVPVEVIN